MQPWWERWPGRLEWELQAFIAVGLDFTLDEGEKRSGRIVLRGEAPLSEDESTEVVVVYPDTFPNTRFAVFAPKLELPRHQNPVDRNLCMLPRGSEYWRPEFRAADFVATDLPQLVALVRTGGGTLRQAEDPQGEPLSEFYNCYGFGGIVVPASALQIGPDHRRGRFQLRFVDDANWLDQMLEPAVRELPDTGVGVLTAVSDYSGELLAECDAELISVCEGPLWWGNWVRFDEFLPVSNPNEFIAEIIKGNPKLEKRKLEHSTAKGRYEITAAVFKEEVQQGRYEDVWIFCLVGSPRGVSNKPTFINVIRGLRFGKEDLKSRIPELAPLSSKSVSIIGLGTLGAPIAIELARSQIAALDLADYDYLNAGTIVRWPYGLTVVGADKTALMERTLRRNYPFTEVEGYPLFVGRTPMQQEGDSEAQLVDGWLSRADLVIDATAESNVSRAVCDISTSMGISQVYVWSIDGYGGVVARLVPLKTGCFHCLEIALSAGGHIAAPKAAASPESLRVQPKGCADPTFTGSAVDLLPLSNQAVRLAFGSLCAGAKDGYPDTDSDVFVLQLRHPDGSLTEVPEWRSYNLPPNPECTICFPESALAS